MPKGIKGFVKGHLTSQETRDKIGIANARPVLFDCDYCGKKCITSPCFYNQKKRHFCSRKCYTDYRRQMLPKEEHNRYGTGLSKETKKARIKCRTIFNHYLRDKKIKRASCEICGKRNSEGHHDDYNKPTEVRWLCSEHHRQYHKENPELSDNKRVKNKRG